MAKNESMVVDLYSGTLSRYFSDDWDRTLVLNARSKAFPTKSPRPRRGLSGEEAMSWVLAVRKGLKARVGETVNWIEDESEAYTARTVSVRAFEALILFGAYADQPKLARPKRLPQQVTTDPGFLAYEKLKKKSWPVLMLADLLVPSAHFNEQTFQTEDPFGRTRVIGASVDYLNDLNRLNRETFGMSEKQMREAARAGGQGDEFETVARFALSAFWEVANYSAVYGRPMVIEASEAPELVVKAVE